MIVEVDAVFGREEPGYVCAKHDAYLRWHWAANIEYLAPRPLGAIWAYCFTSLICEIPYYDWQVGWPGEEPWRTRSMPGTIRL